MPALTEEEKARIYKKMEAMNPVQRRDTMLFTGLLIMADLKPECPYGIKRDFALALTKWYRTRLTIHLLDVLVGEGEEINPFDVVKRIAVFVLESEDNDQRESDRLQLMFDALKEYQR